MKKKFKNDDFRKSIRYKRVMVDETNMDDSSLEIGISKPTLSRIEQGKKPDIDTFIKVLNWLKHNADRYIK